MYNIININKWIEILSDPNNAKEVMDGHLPVLLPKTETVMSVKKSSQPI